MNIFYKIEDNMLFKISKDEKINIEENIGYKDLIDFQIDKRTIIFGEKANIIFLWKKFNIDLGLYEITDKTELIKFVCNNKEYEILPNETLEFESQETGKYSIYTINKDVSNTIIEIEVVNNA